MLPTINVSDTLKSDETESQPAETQHRILAVDLLRGIVMVLMALDHTRDFFSNAFFNPLDLARTTPALFFTRWITHFCAPVFILLAGAGTYLYGARGRTNVEVARFLSTRGLLLIALEFTLVHFGWFFSFEYDFLLAQVIWGIGWSMIILASLVMLRVPLWALTLMSTGMIAGHNLLDGIGADQFGRFRWLWIILHEPGNLEFGGGRELYALYSLIPWIGVMAIGYGLGSILLKSPTERRKWLLGLGAGLTLAFIILRWTNLYGDPQPWLRLSTSALTFMSFINTTKYPPSLLFLLMTLGPALMLLAFLDYIRLTNPLTRVFLIFGCVPLFYYVLHLNLIHALAVMLSHARYDEASWLFGTAWMFRFGLPADYGYELPVVYLVWLAVVTALYPLCYWFSRLKEHSRAGWLIYF